MNKLDRVLLIGAFFIVYLTLYGKLGVITADVKAIRATVTQQAKECHDFDTIEVKNIPHTVSQPTVQQTDIENWEIPWSNVVAGICGMALFAFILWRLTR